MATERKYDANTEFRDIKIMIEAGTVTGEDGQTSFDNTLMPNLTTRFKKLVETTLLLISAQENPFYGLFLSSCRVTVNYNFRNAIQHIATKYPIEIEVNPFFMCQAREYREMLSLVVAEVYRIVMEHTSMCKGLEAFANDGNQISFVNASDVSITQMIEKDSRSSTDALIKALKVSKQMYNVTDLRDECEENSNPDYQKALPYYYRFHQQNKKQDPQDGGSEGGDSGEQSQQGGKSRNGGTVGDLKGQQQDVRGYGQGDGDQAAMPNNQNGNAAYASNQQGNSIDADAAKNAVKAHAKSAMQNTGEKGRGLLPAEFLEMIEKLIAPPQIRWQDLLINALGTVLVPYRRTCMRLNRRQPERADLKGRMLKRTAKVVIAIDDSGSVSKNELEHFMVEIEYILKKCDVEITMLICDAAIHTIYTATKVQDLRYEFNGRGGTYFKPVIDYVNDHSDLHGSILIFCTDGGGEPAIPAPKVHKTIWVVTGDESNLSVKEPYGMVKKLDIKADLERRNR